MVGLIQWWVAGATTAHNYLCV